MMKKKDTGEDGYTDSDPKFAPHRRGHKGVVAGKNPAPASVEDRRIHDEIHRKKREHTLKNYQIMIEYKHLKQQLKVPLCFYVSMILLVVVNQNKVHTGKHLHPAN